MSIDEDITALADQLHGYRLSQDPFTGTGLGLRGYDAGVPDVSAAADSRRREVFADFLLRAQAIDPSGLAAPAAVTLACVVSSAEEALADLGAATIEHTVSGSFGNGPAVILSLASQTHLTTAAAAHDWLARVTGLGDYLDTVLDRLRAGAAAGRTPVATLVQTAIAQLDGLLAAGSPGPLLAPFGAAAASDTDSADPGGDGDDDDEPGWRATIAERVAEEVAERLWPGLVRYREALVTELLPVARDDDHCGLVHLAGGTADYTALVRVHTTLSRSASDIHQQGLDDIAADHARMLEIGHALYGVQTLPEVLDALRVAGADPDPQSAMARAREAVRRAESATSGWFSPPVAPPCAVEGMAALLARAGMAPHYTPPSEDGSRVGTYWFNVDRPGLGTGPELESVTYHEAVPGHHLQLVRMLGLDTIPALQRQALVTAYIEGWALYAETLAEEMGLYSGDEAVLGMLVTDAFRAARLVVDTGIHALGWSRAHAIDFFAGAVPLPVDALTAEVDRYIAMPGQALAYKTGQRHIRELRTGAEQTLGDGFDIRGFHDAVLGSGGIPLPALTTAVDARVADRRTQAS
jgi:uncharacterized protein (DUF885 family)